MTEGPVSDWTVAWWPILLVTFSLTLPLKRRSKFPFSTLTDKEPCWWMNHCGTGDERSDRLHHGVVYASLMVLLGLETQCSSNLHFHKGRYRRTASWDTVLTDPVPLRRDCGITVCTGGRSWYQCHDWSRISTHAREQHVDRRKQTREAWTKRRRARSLGLMLSDV